MDDNIYREGGDKEIKNMQKTSQNNRTAIDKSTDLVYNTGMRNKNTLTKENKMKNFIFCIKEIALMLALIGMVMLAAFGGTAILLSNL